MRTARGMTLIELVVGVLVVAVLAGATTVSLSRLAKSRDASRARDQARARADLAAALIARDVASAVRDGDLYDVRVLVEDDDARGVPHDTLLVFTRSLERVRPDSWQNEGGVYEAQWRLSEDGHAGADRRRVADDGTSTLWRRADPVPDEAPDAGGVAVPMVEGVRSLSIEAFDGGSWYRTWDSDLEGMPHAVRIIVEAVGGEQARRSAVARRVVALDRVPIPYVTLAPEDRAEAAAEEAEGGGGR